MFFGNSNMGIAQLQQELNRGKATSSAHYATKQKDCQEILIRGTDSIVNVSVPGMAPNFAQVREAFGASSTDIYFQVKSFRSSSRFRNIKQSDYIILYISCRYTERNHLLSGDLNQHAITASAGNIKVKLMTEAYLRDNFEEQLASSEELVKTLNDQLLKIAFSADEGVNPFFEDQEFTEKDRSVIVNAFSTFQFFVDANSGQLGIQLKYQNFKQLRAFPAENQPNYPAVPTAERYLTQLHFQIDVPPSFVPFDQLRLAQMLGISFQDNDDVYFLDFRTEDYNMIYLAQHCIYPSLPAGVLDVDFNALLRHYPDPNILDYTTMLSQGQPMDAYINKTIFLRSSLQTNVWYKDGTKDDVIAVFPIETSFTQLPKEYQPIATAGRYYNLRDSLNSLQGFRLSFTTEFGDLIKFTDDYELKIAVFFNPKDAVIQSF